MQTDLGVLFNPKIVIPENGGTLRMTEQFLTPMIGHPTSRDHLYVYCTRYTYLKKIPCASEIRYVEAYGGCPCKDPSQRLPMLAKVTTVPHTMNWLRTYPHNLN